ncbi:MAG: hypothetical protein ROO76_08540 [Terriglobia bacterium]|jgi:uncharacterized membrane protein|nr:hypothetical protein [Terriglobia bacterium]
MSNGYSFQHQETCASDTRQSSISPDDRTLLQNPAFLSREERNRVHSSFRIWLSAIFISVIVFFLALAIQWTIYDRYLHEAGIRVVGSGIAACVSIILVLVLRTAARNQRLRELERLETIALLNHHIRNALQAIVSSSGATNSTDTIRSAVERIEWALGEVLPGIEHPAERHSNPPRK